MIIAPSFMAMNLAQMENQIRLVEKSGAQWLHYDVLDGHFGPNITFGPSLLKAVRQMTQLHLDVHLMIDDPAYYLDAFLKAGADHITFHVESFENDLNRCREFIQRVHEAGKTVGFSLRPATAIEPFEELLECVDLVMVLSVNPGFSGQKFMEDQLPKLEWLKKKREEKNLSYQIQIDGGVNESYFSISKAAGADNFVMGSYVFKNNIIETVKALLERED